MKYQLFGERCSGTNYFESALSLNFPGVEQCFYYGFKHWLQPVFLESSSFPPDMLFVVVIRSPFDWLRSIYRQPWHADHQLRALPFSRFIRAEWRCVWDEQAGVGPGDALWMKEMDFERNPLDGGRRFRNLLELRFVKYRLWSEKLAQHPKVVFINLEAFLADPLPFFAIISRMTSLSMPSSLNMPAGYKGLVSWKRRLLLRSTMGLVGRQREKPKTYISKQDLDFIEQNLSAKQEKAYGYDIDLLLRAELTQAIVP